MSSLKYLKAEFLIQIYVNLGAFSISQTLSLTTFTFLIFKKKQIHPLTIKEIKNRLLLVIDFWLTVSFGFV